MTNRANNLTMHVVDPNAEFRGVSVTKLMDRAGKESCKAILQKFPKPKKVQIFCGGGNNGGDGFALAAELLAKKIKVAVILAVAQSKIRTAAAKHHFARLPREVISSFSGKTKFDGDILVDALLGIGVAGKLKPPFSKIVAKLKKSKAKLVSLDIPTGNLNPNLVIAFHSSKKSPLDPPFAKGGKRSRSAKKTSNQAKQGDSYHEIVVPIGIPKIAETHFGPGDVRVHFPKRKPDSHKNENGRVVIIGGSRDFVGAPLFAGLGATAAGVDLVDVFVPRINFAATRKFSPNFLVHEFPDNPNFLTAKAAREVLTFAKKNKATIVLGPGLGRNPETQKAVEFLARNCRQSLVLDADALLSSLPKFSSKKVVLTPHSSEFRRLPKKLNAVILKKGRVDEIILGKRKRYNDTGNPILTVGGTGDVLAGFVGGLLARGVEPFTATGVSAFLLGLTGEKIALKSESTTPQVAAREIPKIIRQILAKKF